MKIKQILSSDKLQEWVLIIFSVFWVLVVMLDYLNKQIYYIPSITHFKYGLLFTGLIALGVILSGSYTRHSIFSKIPPLKVNGLMILGLMIIVVWSIVAGYNVYWKAPLGFQNYLHLALKVITTLGGAFILTLATYSAGNLFRGRLLPQGDQNLLTFALLDISLGFLFYSLILMLLGAFGLLHTYVIIGVLALLILINYQSSFDFTLKTLWSPLKKPDDLHFWGAFIAFMILVYVAMNYLYTQAPFPLGFDARNYYVNIPKLISESGYLIEGFQPYAWSLIMATGFIAFGSPEITMFISVLGGLLSLFAIYDLSKNHIKIGSNSSLLVALLYLITPTVTNHFIIEFKIDLSLVFIQLVIITVFIKWLNSKEGGIQELFSDTKDRNYLIVIGLLMGFCLSIKVLSLFLTVALFVAVWWFYKNIPAVLGSSALAIGLIIASGFDRESGLREYHLSPNITGFALIGIGLAFLLLALLKNKKTFLDVTKSISMIGICCLLTFSPWIYKNYSYTKSLSPIELLVGKKPTPSLNMEDIQKNYNQSIKKQ